MSVLFWILDENHNPIPATRKQWADMLDNHESRVVKQEQYQGLHISTVFLGLDHSFSSDPLHVPLLFETMIFGLDEEYQDRYATWDGAVKGHNKAKRWARAQLVNKRETT